MLEKNGYGMLEKKKHFMKMSIILHNSPWDWISDNPWNSIPTKNRTIVHGSFRCGVYKINSEKRRLKSYLLLSPNMYGIVSVKHGVILVKKQIKEHL